jgi:hypothetical protein
MSRPVPEWLALIVAETRAPEEDLALNVEG